MIDWACLEENDYLSKAQQQIWLSAFSANDDFALAHKECENARAEAAKRGKPWLYLRAHNNAAESCGLNLSLGDKALGTEDGYQRHFAALEQNRDRT